jgi:probable H4MPT-linked C1 transfer pathway protein
MSWLGLDIGGANLKAADGRGWAASRPISLWRDPDGLSTALRELITAAPPRKRVAVTMTGELCDCFRTKAEGVLHILQAVTDATADEETWAYLVDGRLVPIDEAESEVDLAAASNWHALATFVCRFAAGKSVIMIDIGSTTTDIVPLSSDQVASSTVIDTQRLLRGELVYTGVARTPVCAVVAHLPWGGSQCPVAAEVFATTADAYLLLGDLKPQRDWTWTADGRPLTPEFALERLARMVCADRTQFSATAAVDAAHAIRDAQLARLRAALERVSASLPTAPTSYILSGAGEFLARQLVGAEKPDGRVVSLSEILGLAVSACAPAHALAVLAREALGE